MPERESDRNYPGQWSGRSSGCRTVTPVWIAISTRTTALRIWSFCRPSSRTKARWLRGQVCGACFVGARDSRAATSGGDSMKGSVLIADDEPLARRTLREHLRSLGWAGTIHEAPDGEAAIALA